jgi:tRNA splicing endonuclease
MCPHRPEAPDDETRLRGWGGTSSGRRADLRERAVSAYFQPPFSGMAMQAEDAEWLRQLEAPRGRDGALMCVARWHTNEQLALVEREKGSDMHVFGVYKHGQLWLSAEETLCLVEDGLLELMLGEAPPLSVQRATHELLGRGGASAARKYAVFTHLHRHGFVCRPTALESGCQFPLFEVRHRRGYSRRAVEAGSQPPLFIAAIFDATAQMPPVRELQARPPCAAAASPPAPFLRSA